MKKKLLFTSFFSFSLLLSGCSGSMKSAGDQSQVEPTPQISPVPTMIASPIDSPNPGRPTLTKQVTYTCIKGQTAFDSLFSSKHTAVFKTTSLGKLITQIDGIDQKNNMYWQYSINGKEAQVGADAYKCAGEEVILWELK